MLTCNLLYSQNSTFIKGKEYNGYIFSYENFVFMSVKNNKERYTPSVDDIYN